VDQHLGLESLLHTTQKQQSIIELLERRKKNWKMPGRGQSQLPQTAVI
jgi:hypothetical protein